MRPSARYHDTRSRLLTAVGEVKIGRCWYVCPHCGRGHSPRDRELGIEGIHVSPAVRRMMAVAGSETSFEHGRDQLELPAVCIAEVATLCIEMDGTGVPVVRAEREGRKGKNLGEPARTREVKPGCVFTQTSSDGEGRPVRDENSTTYVGAIENAEAFGLRLYNEAWRRGWSRAKLRVVLGDGAISGSGTTPMSTSQAPR